MNGISIFHIFIALLFIVCIILQLWCVIYFARKKDLKRKWIYIILSFLGFPLGIGIIWATGSISIGIGFKIPAVGFTRPLNEPELWSIFAYFPFGIIFLIKEKMKDNKMMAITQNISEEITQ